MNNIVITDKFQAAAQRFVGSVLAFSVAQGLNPADPNAWQSGHMWPIVGASFFLALVDYVQYLKAPIGIAPTHDGNAGTIV